MPESNAAAKRRQQKANREAGIGDENGRLVRMKEPPKLVKCTICQHEMKITKTNTELTAHASSKHDKALEECFPGAAAIAAELASSGKQKSSSGPAGPSKAQRKAKAAASMDDMLSAGLSTKKKGKK